MRHEVKWPELQDANLKNWHLQVDAHGANDGFIFAAVDESMENKLKLRISLPGNYGMTYDLNNDGIFELFSLMQGSGYYTVHLYSNVAAKKYTEIGQVNFYANLKDKDSPFYIPCQYVNYSKDSKIVQIAAELAKEKTERQYFEAVKDYIRTHFAYDFIKAVTRTTGMRPDIDETMAKCMGICQDLSAIVVAMLRSQGIKSKLVIGFADNHYHAWTVSEIDGKDELYDPTVDVCALGKVNEYTEERVY